MQPSNGMAIPTRSEPEVSYVIRRYAVTQKILKIHADTAPQLSAYLPGEGMPGSEWTVLPLPEKLYLQFKQADAHDQFVSNCLKHIPVAFWQGKSREEIVLTYLSAVDDAMGLLAENIASRITKEVKGT